MESEPTSGELPPPPPPAPVAGPPPPAPSSGNGLRVLGGCLGGIAIAIAAITLFAVVYPDKSTVWPAIVIAPIALFIITIILDRRNPSAWFKGLLIGIGLMFLWAGACGWLIGLAMNPGAMR
jgi:hypothetical protein